MGIFFSDSLLAPPKESLTGLFVIPKDYAAPLYMALIPQNDHRFVSSLIPSKWVGPNKKWPSYHASFFFMARFIMIVSCSSTAIPLECRHSVAMTPGGVVPGATGWAPNYYFRGFIPNNYPFTTMVFHRVCWGYFPTLYLGSRAPSCRCNYNPRPNL